MYSADRASTYTMTVDVTAQNDLPTAGNNTVTTNEDRHLCARCGDFNFADIDGDTLSSVKVTSLESARALKLNGSRCHAEPGRSAKLTSTPACSPSSR